MKKVLAMPGIVMIVVLLMLGFFAWGQWQEPVRPEPASIALLLPDDLPENDHFVRMWQDSASEEGVRIKPIAVSEWVRSTSLRGYAWEGVIVPDTFHRRMDDSVVILLHRYVEGGGRLMLVYDGGLLTGGGFYSPEKSRFSDLAGVNYALYAELGHALAKRSRSGLAQVRIMEQLHIPPGRFAARMQKNSSAGTTLHDEVPAELDAVITDYSQLPQSFATMVTRGTPSQTLMRNEDGGLLAGRQRFGNGETLFVNFPLTYLKQRTDGIFLHSFLHYFAADMLQQPRLASTPDGKGGIVLNWHVDAKPALPAMKRLKELGIFREGPFSFHFTAGPDVDKPGDGGGLNVPTEPDVREMIRSLLAQGHAVGDHGGWIHNYFGNNINPDNQDAYAQYLTLNHNAMTQIAGAPPREYSAPVGNQPPWVTRWLESHGFKAYYQTGNVGMGPTRAWLDTERMSTLWAFPVMTMGPVATAEDAFFQHVPAADYENWLNEVAQFVDKERVLRLVYFHPPGAMLYLNAVNRFVETVKACREAKRCQWLTLTQAADFLTRREQVKWRIEEQPGGFQLAATDAKDLAHMTWWLPKSRFLEPVLMDGQARIDANGADWRITATTGKRLRIGLPTRAMALPSRPAQAVE